VVEPLLLPELPEDEQPATASSAAPAMAKPAASRRLI
jgi:hypothetical protein